jgi:hypothetical protein
MPVCFSKSTIPFPLPNPRPPLDNRIYPLHFTEIIMCKIYKDENTFPAP